MQGVSQAVAGSKRSCKSQPLNHLGRLRGFGGGKWPWGHSHGCVPLATPKRGDYVV